MENVQHLLSQATKGSELATRGNFGNRTHNLTMAAGVNNRNTTATVAITFKFFLPVRNSPFPLQKSQKKASNKWGLITHGDHRTLFCLRRRLRRRRRKDQYCFRWEGGKSQIRVAFVFNFGFFFHCRGFPSAFGNEKKILLQFFGIFLPESSIMLNFVNLVGGTVSNLDLGHDTVAARRIPFLMGIFLSHTHNRRRRLDLQHHHGFEAPRGKKSSHN